MGCCNSRDKDENKSDMEIQGSPYITSSDATKSSYKESIKTCDFRQHKRNDQFFPQYDDRSSIFQNLQNICTKKDSKTIQKQQNQTLGQQEKKSLKGILKNKEDAISTSNSQKRVVFKVSKEKPTKRRSNSLMNRREITCFKQK